MKKAETFEDLWIWQEAKILVNEIYADFKDCHDFGFMRQIQTAGISIMNNIAEGFERSTDPDFARFLDIAKGSSGEVRSMYYPAEDLEYISGDVAVARRERAIKISKGIASLISHLRA